MGIEIYGYRDRVSMSGSISSKHRLVGTSMSGSISSKQYSV